jgi:hypothetical protein
MLTSSSQAGNILRLPPRGDERNAGMTTLQIDPNLPEITSEQSLTGWRREFCIEMLGDGGARVFVRAVEESSLKATELQRAILFHRLDLRFTDLAGCVESIQADLRRLADTVRRTRPDKDNLFAKVEYDRTAWERVQHGVDRWARRLKPYGAARPVASGSTR